MENKKQSRLWDREDVLIMSIERLEANLREAENELERVQHELKCIEDKKQG